MYGYYSSHKAPYPVKIETLHKFSGSKNKNLYDFKKKLIIALNELVKIDFLENYAIEDGKISVKKMTALEHQK